MPKYSDDDHIEFGESGLVPTNDGGFVNVNTGEVIDADGCIYDKDGEVIYDPEEHYGEFDSDEYEWINTSDS